MTQRGWVVGLPLALLTVALGLARCSAAPLSPEVEARVARNPPLGPVPADPTNRFAESDAAAELGHRIFFDPRFSASGRVSCATCHDPAHGFADGRTIAVGEGRGTRHSMSVLNTAYNRWFTWDGRADTLWSQALQPLETPHEQGITRARAVALVAADPTLNALYEQAFGTTPPLNRDRVHAPLITSGETAAAAELDAAFANMGKALAAYERHLVTEPSAYDRWWVKHAAAADADADAAAAAAADADAELPPGARRGLAIFFGKANCWQCHHGANFTDGEFHLIGVPQADGDIPRDPGRYAVVDGVRTNPFNAAGPHSDARDGSQARISAALARSPDLWGEVKTPSLRTAARTGPYMHQGQLKTLADVVHFYSTLEGATALDHHREQVLRKLDLTREEQADLVEFLRAIDSPGPGAPWGVAPAPAQPSAAGPVGGKP